MKKHIILIVLFTLFAGMTTLSAQDERLVQDSLRKEISEIRRSGHFYFQEKRDEDKEVAREEALSMLKHDVKDSLASMLSSKKEIEELMEILEENVSQISYRAYGSDSYRVFLFIRKSTLILNLPGSLSIPGGHSTVTISSETTYEKTTTRRTITASNVDYVQPQTAETTVQRTVSSHEVEMEKPQPVREVQSVVSSEPMEEDKSAESPKPVEKAKPVETSKPVEESKHTETPKPVEEAKPVEIPKPVEEAKPAEASKPVEVVKPVETRKPVADTQTVSQPKLMEAAKPVESPKREPVTLPVTQQESAVSEFVEVMPDLPESAVMLSSSAEGNYKEGDKDWIDEFMQAVRKCITKTQVEELVISYQKDGADLEYKRPASPKDLDYYIVVYTRNYREIGDTKKKSNLAAILSPSAKGNVVNILTGEPDGIQNYHGISMVGFKINNVE